MYALVLATLFTTGNDVPDFGRRGGCRGGGWGGCYGACYGCWGCYGSCWGGWGGCYGCYGGYSAWYGGCFGCGGGCSGMVISSGCGGGGVIYSGGCSGGAAAAASGSRGGSGAGVGSGAGGQGGVSSEAAQTLQELKKSLAELKKEQEQLRTEALKQVAETLRLEATNQKIDELRRTIEDLRKRLPASGPIPLPMPQPAPGAKSETSVPKPQPGKVRLEMPADALLVVNGKPIAVTSTFLTPPIQPGQEYAGTFEATVTRDGQSITRVKRLTIRPGAEVRLAFEDMKPAEETWSGAEAAHITVRLPADARLSVDGKECPLTSATRTFDTPALVPGREYYYVLKVEMMRDGRPITQTKRVAFRAGERVAVSFDSSRVESLTSR